MTQALSDFLAKVKAREPLPIWREREASVSANFAALERYAAAQPGASIYGFNTLPGHRDSQEVSGDDIAAFQERLVRNHLIEGFEFAPELAARCIGYAKLMQIAAIGSFISGPLYKNLQTAVCARDFQPRVPLACSYSSGDVIPAAHWAEALIAYCRRGHPDFALRPGEGMALINGSFVHVGFAAFVLDELRAIWSMLIDSMRVDVGLAETSARTLRQAGVEMPAVMRYIAECASGTDHAQQQPVSFRAIPQTVDALVYGFTQLAEQTTTRLLLPSGNPVMMAVDSAVEPCPQGSFLAPALSIATGAVMEALQFALWSLVERTKYLLSGKLSLIAVDGSSEHDPLGYIQWPKYMQALLEEIRIKWGRAIFASGGNTSYGTEDLWTLGLTTLGRLREGAMLGERLCALGLILRLRLAARTGRGAMLADGFQKAAQSDAADGAASLIALFRQGTQAGAFYPV